MPDDRVIYSKTPKGTAEIGARSGALSMAERRVLIMVDGKRTLADLAPLARAGEIGPLLENLEAQGFIQRAEGVALRAPAATGTAEVADPADDLAEERLVAAFDTVKRRAVRELSDRLGPDAEVMAVRIENCRTPEELRQRLREAERLVAGMLGDAHAQEFLRALRRR
jgi:hypothetical protein